MRPFVRLATGAGVLCIASAAVAGPSGIHLLKSVTLGGDTFWDCITLDAPNHHLFIAHGSHFVVVDSRTGSPVGDIPDTPGAHEVAVAGPSGKGFATSGTNNSVVVFDAKTLATTGKIAVGTRPDGILYDPVSRRVFTFNAGSKDSTVIDAASGTVDGTIALGGKPEFAVADGKGHIFDNIEDTSEIVEIDTHKMEVMKRWPLAPCTEPSGLAYDSAHGRLFAACDNGMMAAVDAATGKVVATVPTGKGADGAGFDAQGARCPHSQRRGQAFGDPPAHGGQIRAGRKRADPVRRADDGIRSRHAADLHGHRRSDARSRQAPALQDDAGQLPAAHLRAIEVRHAGCD